MKTNSLAFKIWVYLALFLTIILFFIWVLQILFLNAYYEWVTKNSMKDIGNYVLELYNKDSSDVYYNALSYDNNVCIEIVTNGNIEYTSEAMNRGCLYYTSDENILDYKTQFTSSNKQTATYTINNPQLNNKTIIYALKINENTNAYINASLEPMDRSIIILKQELIYVTIIVYITSFIVALYISRNISKPIIDMSNGAKKIAEGNYDTPIFTDSNIEEIEKLAEALNLARVEMGKTDELRRDLMANVSHDLKTPLTMIRAYAEMTRDLDHESLEKKKENLNIIIEEADRLNILVNDLLELSKNEERKNILNKTQYDLTEQIKTILKRFQLLVETENYKFIFRRSKPLIIEADEKKIEQVIYNLLTNAVNYTGKDKKVIIEIKENKTFYRVSIKDTGKGIDPEEIDVIWDKYYKNEKNHQRNKIGTGLGLSICKTILMKHKWNYGVESKKGKGTKFYFDIAKENVNSQKNH